MIKYGRALYYPSIEFHDLNWFKLSTFFYDGLDRIVPKDSYYFDHDEIRKVNDEIGYIRNVDPKSYAKKASDKYLDYFINNILILGDEKIQEIISRNDEKQFRIHHDKLGSKLIYEIKEIANIQEDKDWYSFPSILGFSYMTFLANEIGEKKKLPVITDYEKNQITLNTTQLNSEIDNEDLSFNLASLAVKSYLPKDIQAVSARQLIDFRKKHESERIRFYTAINALVEDLNNIKEKEVLDDILNFRKKEIDSSVEDLRLSLRGLGIDVKEGLLGVSLPSALQLLPDYVQYSAQIKLFGAIAALVVLGGKSYITHRKIKRESPYSYLLSIENSDLGKEQLLKQLLKGKIII